MLNTIPENMIEKAVSELKETNVLKYIWGGAQCARKIKNYLECNGIGIDGFLINRKYVRKDLKEWC